MLCVYCGKEFNEKLNVPRLLITCGHSLCESCCYRMHLNSRVQCPQCHSSTFIESISLLPKNLALISQNSSLPQCAKHMKRYEAFCQKQNMLICIDCILSDGHKNHQMQSISNCFQKLKTRWETKMDKIHKYSQRLETLLEENSKTIQEGEAQYTQTLQNVTLFFREIRQIVNKDEDALLTRLRESYQQTSLKYTDKNNSLSNLAENINLSIDNLSRYENLSEIEFLESFSSRQSLYNSIGQPSEEPLKLPSYTFSKKSIVESLSKSLTSILVSEKPQKQLGSPGNSNSNYNTATNFKKGSDIPVIKAVRKAPIPVAHPNPSSINLSNKKKVSMKKEPISILQTPSGTSSKSSNSSAKEQFQSQGNFNHPLRSDISAVDPKESLCHSFLSNMTSFLGERKSIYLVGGFNEQASNIVKLNLFSWNWQQVCSLSSNRSKFGSVALDQQLFLFGGKKGKERVGDSEVYNVNSNRWTKSFPMSRNRSGFAVVSVGQLLYFIGGNDGDNILNTVQTLKVSTGEWKKCESMIQARDELAVVVGKNNKIYAIGGFGGPNNEPLRSAEVYDPKIEKWKMLPLMNEPRRALAAAILADGIYAIGGFDGTNYMKSVQRLEQGQSQWKYVASMSQARCTHSAVSLSQSQQILVFGGFDYVPLDSVQKYNVISNEWESICKMPTPRFMHSSILIRED